MAVIGKYYWHIHLIAVKMLTGDTEVCINILRKEESAMKIKTYLSIFVMLTFIFVTRIEQSFAQIEPVYVTLGGGAHGTLNKPTSGTYSHIGIVVTHRTANVLGACTGWASRGFLAFCLNFPWVNNEAAVMWEDTAIHVGSAVKFLKSQPGITKIVLVGASGGGPTFTYYQAVAQNGPSYCQGSNKLIECSNSLTGLIPADGIILNDAHPGNPTVAILRQLNPAVTNDRAILDHNRPARINPNLDPFDPKNGYNPNGPSTYSENFKQRYFKAEADRMNILIDEALQRLREIEASKYPDDDAPLIIVRGHGARLAQLDLSVHHSTVNPQKLLKNDGTVSVQIVESVRVANPGLIDQNPTFDGGTAFLTVRSFLSANAIRATDAMDESKIDWCSSNNSTRCALEHITVPLLIVSSGGHYFIRDGEMHYERAASTDKDFIVTEGAAHTGPPCVPCEQFPGQYANSAINQMNYMVNWVNTPGRF